jgi:hypothetical protein
VAFILVLLILIISLQNALSVYADVSIKDPNLKAELVVNGLKSPTSMSFLAEDDLLVVEKAGIVQRILGNTILEHPVLNIGIIIYTLYHFVVTEEKVHSK